VRIALPIVTATTVPTPAFENYVLQTTAAGRQRHPSPALLSRRTAIVPFYRNMLRYTCNTAGRTACSAVRSITAPAAQTEPEHFTSEPDREQVQTRAPGLQHRRIEHHLVPVSIRHWPSPGRLHGPHQSRVDLSRHQPPIRSAAGYTHVFSPSLVNYFNPPSPGMRASSARPIFRRRSPPSPSFCRGAVHNPRGPRQYMGSGPRAARFFINDNLAWTFGKHELRFGTTSASSV